MERSDSPLTLLALYNTMSIDVLDIHLSRHSLLPPMEWQNRSAGRMTGGPASPSIKENTHDSDL